MVFRENEGEEGHGASGHSNQAKDRGGRFFYLGCPTSSKVEKGRDSRALVMKNRRARDGQGRGRAGQGQNQEQGKQEAGLTSGSSPL